LPVTPETVSVPAETIPLGVPAEIGQPELEEALLEEEEEGIPLGAPHVPKTGGPGAETEILPAMLAAAVGALLLAIRKLVKKNEI
jgi:hypothetical protein